MLEFVFPNMNNASTNPFLADSTPANLLVLFEDSINDWYASD